MTAIVEERFAPPLTWLLSGRILSETGLAAGVTVRAVDQPWETVTGADGEFAFEVPDGWCGNLTLHSSVYLFSPPNLIVPAVRADMRLADVSTLAPEPFTPGFLVRVAATGSGRVYAEGQSSWNDEYISANASYLGDGRWRLDLQNKNADLSEVWFPFRLNPTYMGDDPDDDVFFYPVIYGIAILASSCGEFDWDGLSYPGAASAPLVIMADEQAGQIVAASEWPPRPRYSSFLTATDGDPLRGRCRARREPLVHHPLPAGGR